MSRNGKKPVAANTEQTVKPKTVIGEYRVNTAKTFFHNEPDAATRRGAFLSKGDPVKAYDERENFIYTEFTNSRGQTSKGWLRRDQLLTADEWIAQQQQPQDPNQPPSSDEIKTKLTMATGYLRNNQLEDALGIYNLLAPFDVPEALYQAGNFALLGKNASVSCTQGIAQLTRASDLGYLPAKRTLGMLHLFAENGAWLQINGYTNCSYPKDIARARSLLTQAANGGDTAARQVLNELSLANPPQ